MLRKNFLLFSIIVLGYNAGQNSLHFDIGGYLGMFQATENNKFPDHSDKKFTFKSDKSVTDSETTHNCNLFCDKFKPKKRSIYGGSLGIFYDISKLASFGIEGNLSWHKINIDEIRNSFICNNPNCTVTGDTVFGNTNTKECREFFSADRYYTIKDIDKVNSYTYRILSVMLAAKFFFQDGSSYLKIGAGLGGMLYKGPIMKKESTDHSYQIKQIHLKKGIAFKIAMHTFISPKTTVGLEFYNQSNKSKDKITTYRTNAITIGFYSNF